MKVLRIKHTTRRYRCDVSGCGALTNNLIAKRDDAARKPAHICDDCVDGLFWINHAKFSDDGDDGAEKVMVAIITRGADGKIRVKSSCDPYDLDEVEYYANINYANINQDDDSSTSVAEPARKIISLKPGSREEVSEGESAIKQLDDAIRNDFLPYINGALAASEPSALMKDIAEIAKENGTDCVKIDVVGSELAGHDDAEPSGKNTTFEPAVVDGTLAGVAKRKRKKTE